ncbi:DoxX family protein [Mycolicibacterium moriokaense]|uniref:DoxX-like protein n=1 Tax=Mycolicibacterium moriokaense TaxID=39691 RepID=A0A318H758_9MYCO|nr:DoxX family protein [Mycolicibacterium moriokaense]PXX00376.1 DoxX-like protein [Mycolicibacterium moriokaense]
MNIALWVLQGVLAIGFTGAGLMKVVTDMSLQESLGMGWIKNIPPPVLKALGVAEVLGAIGVVLPAVVRVAPILVPIAATCLAVVTFVAVVAHLRFHEIVGMLPAAVLFIAAVVVAWGRFGPYAF